MINDSATYLASTAETRFKNCMFKRTAIIGLTLESKKLYLNSFLVTKAVHTFSAALLAI